MINLEYKVTKKIQLDFSWYVKKGVPEIKVMSILNSIPGVISGDRIPGPGKVIIETREYIPSIEVIKALEGNIHEYMRNHDINCVYVLFGPSGAWVYSSESLKEVENRQALHAVNNNSIYPYIIKTKLKGIDKLALYKSHFFSTTKIDDIPVEHTICNNTAIVNTLVGNASREDLSRYSIRDCKDEA